MAKTKALAPCTHDVITALKNEGFSIREIAKGGHASKSKVEVVS